MSLVHTRPPIVAQTLTDSCWAAVIDCWSRVETGIPRQHQADLIRSYGEGPTGGITPVTKIPVIAQVLGVQFGGFTNDTIEAYIRGHLEESYLFCAYTRGAYTHAVLIFSLAEQDTLTYMDPDGGHIRHHPLSWLARRGPFVTMRKVA